MLARHLIFDEPERVAEWCRERIPNYIGWNGYYQAIGEERYGQLVCGVVYTNASPTNIVASTVLEAPLTRRFLYAVFYYPFIQLQVRRCTALVEAWNRRSIEFVKHLGFIEEGRMRDAAYGGGDVIVYGLLRSECRFLVRPRA